MLIPTGVRDQSRRGCGARTEVLEGVLATEQRGCLWVTGFVRVSGRKQGDTRDSPRLGASGQDPMVHLVFRQITPSGIRLNSLWFSWIQASEGQAGPGLTKSYLVAQGWTWSNWVRLREFDRT